ncbi:MAG: hypothetical protein DRH24_16290 [Deltaproteobacteria bacterium]|nr:MAG: hypothetical protein DRH24_16290 [Deltaproteobacteria bacterium]
MKILLIQPYANESNTNYPPMGLLYLASYIREKSTHAVKIIDLRVNKTPIKNRLSTIKMWEPDIIGLTGMSIEWTGFKEVLHTIKPDMGKKIIFVAGGPHATIFNTLVLEKTPVEYVIKGEGEETFLELINALDRHSDIRKIKGLSYRNRHHQIIETPDREPIKEINRIPFPAYDLVPMEDYFVNPHFHGNLNKYRRILPIITSRGCPFHCSFCFHMFGNKFRPRSAENILEEIDWLVHKYRIREFQIEDDIFNFHLPRAKKIMRKVIGRGYNLAISFPNGIRADLIDEELMALFKEAGVYRIHFGIETAVPRIQKIASKPINMNKLKKAIELTFQAGISSHGFFMIGFPTETETEIKKTIRYAKTSKLATANFSIVKTYPGTPIGDAYLDDSKKSFDDDFSFSSDSTTTNYSRVPDARLKQLQRMAMISFYFRPGRIWQIFKTSPNKRNLFFRNIFSTLDIIIRGKTKY